MTRDEHLQALQRQVQYLQEQLHAPAIPAQWRADRAIMAETANVAETAMASNSQASANANEPAREEHTLQPRALAKSNAATYAQAVMRSDPPVSPMKRSTRANDFGGDHPTNAASSSATAGTEPAIMMSPTVLRHNLAHNAEAAALQAAADADADAAAICKDPRVLRAVLLAVATTANALAQTIPQDTVLAHRRGGRPPPTRRANPRARQRRTRRPTGTP
jgi:hypothetical protein